MKYIYSPLLSTWVLLDLASPPCDLYFDAAKKSLFEHCILSAAAGSYDLSVTKLKFLFSPMIFKSP